MIRKKVLPQLMAFILVLVCMCGTAEALSLSPSELKIKNVDVGKNYQFILLITSEEEGLRNFELKTSHKFVSLSPDRFMLSKGEKKSVRLSIRFPKNLEEGEGEVRVQPYANNMPTQERLVIKYSNSAIKQEEQPLEDKKAFYEDKNIILGTIYALIIIVSGLIILFILPDIKRTTVKISQNVKKRPKKKRIRMNKKSAKKIKELEKRLNSTDEKIQKMTANIEGFIDSADDWLKNNSGGKYGLE